MSNNPRPHPATNVPLISSALCPAIPQGSATLQLFPEQVPGILELSHPNLSKASSKVHRKHHSPGQPSWSHLPRPGPSATFYKTFFIWLYQVLVAAGGV